MTKIEPMTDAEALATLKAMRHAAGSLFRALDTDGDGVLSEAEIAAAPEVLRAMANDEGNITEEILGGPTAAIQWGVRQSALVRMLDDDGDLIIGPDDMADAVNRILQLDFDGDGRVSAFDDMPPPGSDIESLLPMGTPKQTLAFLRKMFNREPEIYGPNPPKNQEAAQPGYTLIQESNNRMWVQMSKKTALLNEAGEVVHEWFTDEHVPEGTVVSILPNGNLMRTLGIAHYLKLDEEFPVGAYGLLSIVDKDSNELWRWEHYHPGAECIHHPVEVMPNGNILCISYVRYSAEEAHAIGWQQQGSRAAVFLEKVYEIKPDLKTGGTDIVWEWTASDHLIQNADPNAPGYGDPLAHPEKISLNWPQLDDIMFNKGQLIHMNAVSYNAEEDVIMLSAPIFGEIWLIDHSTTTEEAKGSTGGRYGKGGDLIYRWGDGRSIGEGTIDDKTLWWQHSSYFLADDVPHEGEIIVFSNGLGRGPDGKIEPDQICMGYITGSYSDVIEVKLPRDENGLIAFGVAPEIVWHFNKDGSTDIYCPFMSGAQRLPNGNTLMAQGSDKRIMEVSHSGEVVLDYKLGGPGRMYRATKYAPDHPGIKALGL